MADPGGALRVSGTLTIPAVELGWRFSRSSGPGGQSVNTSDSRVELVWDVHASTAVTEHQRARILTRLGRDDGAGPIVVVAAEHRSQLRNREAARDRLAELLRAAIAPPSPRRRPTRPSRSSVERRLTGKRRRSQAKRTRRPPGQDE